MAKFYGDIGFAEAVEKSPRNWTEDISIRSYAGDMLQSETKREDSSEIHDNIRMDNRISIIMDEYAAEHYFAIRFVKLAGVNWEVTSVKRQYPRLILSIGGVYNGPTE